MPTILYIAPVTFVVISDPVSLEPEVDTGIDFGESEEITTVVIEEASTTKLVTTVKTASTMGNKITGE